MTTGDDQTALRAQIAALEDALHSARGDIARFAARIAHDLTNTMGTIRGFAELIAEDLPPDSPIRPTTERIHSSAERSLTTLREAAAEARTTVVELAPEQVDLAASVQAAADAVGSPLQRADVTLDIDGTETVPGSARKLAAVFAELLRNVATHAPGSRVIVRFERSPERVFVTLADEGPGVEGTQIERVFEPGVTLRGSGGGDGLTRTRTLVEDHGGRVWLTSVPGAGTTVHLALPVLADR